MAQSNPSSDGSDRVDATTQTNAVDSDAQFVEAPFEESPLLTVFTPESKLRIIQALQNAVRPLPTSTLCERASITPNTFREQIATLIEYDIVEVAHTHGNSDFYQLANPAFDVKLHELVVEIAAHSPAVRAAATAEES